MCIRDRHGGDCGERDAGRGLWEMGCMEGTVGKGMQGGDYGEQGCREGTVGKGMQGGDCGKRDAERDSRRRKQTQGWGCIKRMQGGDCVKGMLEKTVGK